MFKKVFKWVSNISYAIIILSTPVFICYVAVHDHWVMASFIFYASFLSIMYVLYKSTISKK